MAPEGAVGSQYWSGWHGHVVDLLESAESSSNTIHPRRLLFPALQGELEREMPGPADRPSTTEQGSFAILRPSLSLLPSRRNHDHPPPARATRHRNLDPLPLSFPTPVPSSNPNRRRASPPPLHPRPPQALLPSRAQCFSPLVPQPD